MEHKFTIVALPAGVADEVRITRKSPRYGHPVHQETAKGFGPCRQCLRAFDAGRDQRILFTWDPFRGVGRIPLPGPVFIHAEACERYPENAGYPKDLRGLSVLMTAYETEQNIVAKELVAAGGEPEAAIRRLLATPQVRYIEVRNATAGCFDFHVFREVHQK